jgi:hypothetical protein
MRFERIRVKVDATRKASSPSVFSVLELVATSRAARAVIDVGGSNKDVA